eukprot:scaffold562214_cov36-Prasinocladus_malaysianus.AAC.1
MELGYDFGKRLEAEGRLGVLTERAVALCLYYYFLGRRKKSMNSSVALASYLSNHCLATMKSGAMP